MLSLCKRAGGLRTGGFTCEKTLKSGKARLVIVSMDASGNTKKKFSQKAFYYSVPYREALTKEELGRAIGADEAAVIIITDNNFSSRILKLVEADSNNVT